MLESIDLNTLNNVVGGRAGDAFDETVKEVKQGLSDTADRYRSAGQGYYDTGKNLATGKPLAAAKSFGGAVVDHAAGGFNLVSTGVKALNKVKFW